MTPQDLAWTAHGRLEGTLPDPVVGSDPPAGTDAIITVPVFIHVENLSGPVTVGPVCAGGLCVTATASPHLVYVTGVPGVPAVGCGAGPGRRYDPNGAGLEVQADAAGACTYPYLRRTHVSGRPEEWPAVVQVRWAVGWEASSGATGTLPDIVRETPVARGVVEVNTVVVDGHVGEGG